MPIIGEVWKQRAQQRALAGIVLPDNEIDPVEKSHVASVAKRLKPPHSCFYQSHFTSSKQEGLAHNVRLTPVAKARE